MTKRRDDNDPPFAEHRRIQELKALAKHDQAARQELLSIVQKSRTKGGKILLSDLTLTTPGHARINSPPAPPSGPHTEPEPAFEVTAHDCARPQTKQPAKRKRKAARSSTATRHTDTTPPPKKAKRRRRYIEDAIQIEVASWLSSTELDRDWLHPPLEQFSARWAKQMAKKGARSGWPDIIIFRPTKTGFKGVGIELKRPDRQREGKPRAGLSRNQTERLDRLTTFGWFTAVAYSFEQVKALVTHHYGDVSIRYDPGSHVGG